MPRINVTNPVPNPKARWYKPWVPAYTEEVIGYVEYTLLTEPSQNNTYVDNDRIDTSEWSEDEVDSVTSTSIIGDRILKGYEKE